MNELKYYVGTGLKFRIHKDGDHIEEERGFTGIHFSKSTTTIWFGEIGYSNDYFDFKPILKPLSVLKYRLKAWKSNGVQQVFLSGQIRIGDLWDIANGEVTDWRQFQSKVLIFLLERQYDVFGLLDKGLAIRSMKLEESDLSDL